MSRRNPWLMPSGVDRFIPVVVLWDRFAALYGARWRELFVDDAAKSAWMEEAGALFYLRGIRYQMVKQALEKLRASIKAEDEPVSLLVFADMCLPSFDFEGAFYEAKQQQTMLLTGRAVWSHPAIYWAASDYGFNRLGVSSWTRAKGEWVRLLASRLQVTCMPVPDQTKVVEYRKGDIAVGNAALKEIREQLWGRAA